MKKYYYSDGLNRLGPFSLEELKQKNITKEHLVWFESMNDWQKAGTIDELKDLFNVPAPPTPSQKISNSSRSLNSDFLDDNIYRVRPTNYLWQSIVVTVLSCFCCNLLAVPFAIAGIVNATKVNPAYDSGDYAGAERASKMAKQWTTVAFVIGCVLFVIQFLIGLAGVDFDHLRF